MNSIGFIFLIDGSNYKPMYECMFADANNMDNVCFVVDEPIRNRRKNFLLKKKIQLITKGWFDYLAYEENKLFNYLDEFSKKYRNIVVIFTNASLAYNSYLTGTLKRYKRQFDNLYYVLYYLDIMNVNVSRNADILRQNGIFDLVYTIDKKDAKRTGSILWNTCYSKCTEFKNESVIHSFYFCGVSKGRTAVLSECAKIAEKEGVDYLMDIICEDDTVTDIFKYNKIRTHSRTGHLAYQEVLNNELQSNCILDIVQENQCALSLRAFEAVVYNKKLITNNKSILEFKYYDKNKMLYFSDPKEIDWTWVKDQQYPKYYYKNDFSVILLLQNIELRIFG